MCALTNMRTFQTDSTKNNFDFLFSRIVFVALSKNRTCCCLEVDIL